MKSLYDRLSSQKGFSIALVFFLGLGLLILMNATGFFNPPTSPVTDTTQYTVSNNPKSASNSLHLIDLKFSTPTPTPKSVTTPAPTQSVPLPSVCTPPPGNYCDHDTQLTSSCTCNPCLPVGLFCNGKKPPDNPDCTTADPSCQAIQHNNPSCVYYCLGKPVIYLYPQKPTFVTVTLGKPDTIIESIPSYGQGWKDVLALPGGILKYQDKYYNELYYELSADKINPPANGIFINRDDLKPQLQNLTQKLGLLPNESQEFVDYWVPRLQQLNKPYILFSVLSNEEKERTDTVKISPTPDTFIEFIAYFKGVDKPYEITPLAFPETPKRIGFTAVEWGGVIGK